MKPLEGYQIPSRDELPEKEIRHSDSLRHVNAKLVRKKKYCIAQIFERVAMKDVNEKSQAIKHKILLR